jgi:hypothetical protein
MMFNRLCLWVATFTLAAFLSTLPARVAHACLNDRDTLANEANRLPDVLRVITGRFERDPPLYYQMRIDRLTAAAKSRPLTLPEYDDIAVAFDRIGLDDDGLAWMGRKKARLPRLSGADADVQEQWYRYYANTGTLLVHRWARAGADRTHMDEVQEAEEDIGRAIAIKPDAHFGREKYQYKVMQWILDGSPGSLADYLLYMPGDNVPNPKARDEAVTALSGLVVLGNAWESADIFDAISRLLGRSRWDYTERLSALARLRRDEIIDCGGKSLMPDSPTGEALKQRLNNDLEAQITPDDVHDYRKLRAEADRWQSARTAFMMARLQVGSHPDTDPNFWRGYKDSPPPALHNPWDEAIYLALGAPLGIEYFLFWGIVWIILIIAGARGLRRLARRVRNRRVPA